MIFRPLNETQCSVLGLGTGMLCSVSAGLSTATRLRLIETAFEAGVNLIDTADSYAQGDCENFLGKALRGRRDKFLIATKAGYQFASLGGLARFLKPLAKSVVKRLRGGRNLLMKAREGALRHGGRSHEFAPDRIAQCIEASLRRLQTDRIDVFFLHDPPAEVLRDERLLKVLADSVVAGKTLRFGVSTSEPAVLAAALEMPGASALEVPLHPGAMAATGDLLTQAAQRQWAIFGNHFSYAGRLLRPFPEETPEQTAARLQVAQLASAEGLSPHHLLLKFALSHPGVTSVLTGTTNPAHLKENLADALSEAAISPETLAVLRAAKGFPAA